jgi:hypothetical protein
LCAERINWRYGLTIVSITQRQYPHALTFTKPLQNDFMAIAKADRVAVSTFGGCNLGKGYEFSRSDSKFALQLPGDVT